MLVRFKTGNLNNTMEQLKVAFTKVLPTLDFNYSFLDQHLAKLYEREKRAGQISIIFCLLAIFVAALGLFGLTAFMAEQRKKEIGIRKVLGASILSITSMLTVDFAKLVLISIGIAFPLAYILMNNWLESFAYHIDMSWWIFALSGVLAVSIAFFTVSFQAIKAAVTNPVRSLRTE
jgi:ABC-type antimicrobial peptide transport system permease subunit